MTISSSVNFTTSLSQCSVRPRRRCSVWNVLGENWKSHWNLILHISTTNDINHKVHYSLMNTVYKIKAPTHPISHRRGWVHNHNLYFGWWCPWKNPNDCLGTQTWTQGCTVLTWILLITRWKRIHIQFHINVLPHLDPRYYAPVYPPRGQRSWRELWCQSGNCKTLWETASSSSGRSSRSCGGTWTRSVRGSWCLTSRCTTRSSKLMTRSSPAWTPSTTPLTGLRPLIICI